MILAIDPGGTTGIAHITRDGQFGTLQIEKDAEGFFSWWGTNGPFLGGETLDAVVAESFNPRPGVKSQQLGALYILGFLKGWCQLNGVPFYLQTPAQGKSFGTDEKIKCLGLWSRGMGHAVDATRHLVTWMCGSIEGRRIKGDEWLGVLSQRLSA